MATNKKIAVVTLFILLGALLLVLVVDCRFINIAQRFHAPASKPPVRALQAITCPFFETYGRVVKCYSIRVWQNNTGVALRVPVAVFSRHSHDKDQSKLSARASHNTALIHIPGGPGAGDQLSLQGLEYWSGWYYQADITQDLVVYNPRGLLGSAPFWNCERYDQEFIRLLAKNISFSEEQKLAFNLLSTCIDDLHSWLEKRMPGMTIQKYFSNKILVEDIYTILSELGYENWHLWGASHGTRLALEGAHHPNVRSVVLDGVYPPGVGGIGSTPQMYERAMYLWQGYFQQHQTAGVSSYSELLASALKNIQSNPEIYRVSVYPKDEGLNLAGKHLQKIINVQFTLNAQRLKSVMFFVLYSPDLVEPFIEGLRLIASDSVEKNASMQFVVEVFIQNFLDPAFNSTLYFLAECEESSKIDKSTLDNLLMASYSPEFPAWREWVRAEYQWDICRHKLFYPGGRNKKDWQYAQKPTLIFSGQNDPVTPPAWGQLVADSIESSRHIVVEDSSHGVLTGRKCQWSFWNGFLEKGHINQTITCEVVK